MKTLKITLIALLTIISGIAAAQNTNQPTTIDLLMSTKWTHTFMMKSTPVILIQDFELRKMKLQTLFYEKDQTTLQRKIDSDYIYYLSDKPDTVFNEKMVGKVQNGKYLITRKYKDHIRTEKIVSISKDELLLLIIRKTPPKNPRFAPVPMRYTPVKYDT